MNAIRHPAPLQSQMMLLGCGSSGGGSVFVGALDSYTTNLKAAVSVARRLLVSYTGSLIRVRADRTGQPEQDIGYTAEGDMDTAALTTFLNGDTGYIVTVYDQSGLGHHVTQSDAAKQPLSATAGNGFPCARWTQSTTALLAASFTLAAPYSRLSTGILRSALSGLYYGDGASSDSGITCYTGTVSGSEVKAHIYAGTFLPAYNAGSVVDYVDRVTCVRAEFNGVTSLLQIDVLSATGASGLIAPGGITIGNRASAASGSAARDWFEEVVWSDINTSRNNSVTSASEAYY